MSSEPWNPSIRADPHSYWNALRDTEPVAPRVGPVTGTTFWFLTRYDDCVAALRSPVLGKEPEKHLDPSLLVDFGEQGPFEVLGRNMLFVDPPDHTRLRGLVRDGFSNRAVEGLVPRIEAVVDDLLDELGDRSSFDLIESFALPLPVTVIAEMLGVPASDQSRFRAWTDAFLGRVGTQEEAMAAGMEFIAYLNDLAERRRAEPHDDLVSFLLHAEEDGERLDHQEFLAMVFLLLIAGHETTVNLIGNGIYELTRHPDEYGRLLEGRVTVEAAVEELLRFHGPVESTTVRWAYEDVTIGGVTLPPGSPVIPILMAANRDPSAFDEPDRLRLDRSPNRHLAFGSGIHLCLGAPLARREAQVAFAALSRRLGRLELDMDPASIDWTQGFFLRGARALQLRPTS
ncbi:MAG TPA: cytochrome P450 [Acidimicrobiia bacterium]|nr:cytochrome P450 [Acidimicrobiia bacterium]